MNMDEERPMNQYRMSARGLEPLTQEHDRDLHGGGKKLGLGDKKKVAALAALVLVCAGVVAFQFLRGKGAQTADASLAIGTAVRPGATSAGEIEAVLKQLEAESTGQKDLSVTRVEELVREFDGYVRQRQVPLSALRVNPFVVSLPKPPEPAVAAAPSGPDPAALKVAAEEAHREQIRRVGASLSLGTILVSNHDRLAVVSGTVCRVGDVIAGFQVARIEPGEVVLTCEDETVTLALFAREGAGK